MIKTGVIVSNPFQENTYVLWDETGEAVVVDAGNYTPKETEALRGFIEEKGLRPVLAVIQALVLGIFQLSRVFAHDAGKQVVDTF